MASSIWSHRHRWTEKEDVLKITIPNHRHTHIHTHHTHAHAHTHTHTHTHTHKEYNELTLALHYMGQYVHMTTRTHGPDLIRLE